MSQAVEPDDRDDIEPATDDDAAVSILTNGDPLRSWVELPDAIVDECRLRIDDDGLHVAAADPANVAMLETTFRAEGFRGFDAPDSGVTFGLNLDRFTSAISWARKRGDDGDPVSIDLFDNPPRMRVSVTRTDQRMKRVSEWFGIDPNNIRQEPDTPDLSLPDRADPAPSNLVDAVEAVDDHRDYAYITRDSDTFVLASQESGDTKIDPDDDTDAETGAGAVYMPETAWSDGEGEATSSLFSLDYLTDMAAAIKQSKADRLTVHWGDEFPVELHFDHEDWGITSQFLLAPRLEPDDA